VTRKQLKVKWNKARKAYNAQLREVMRLGKLCARAEKKLLKLARSEEQLAAWLDQGIYD